MEADFDKILLTRRQIALRVREMAKEIANLCQKHAVEELTLVAILSGSVIVLADLIRNRPIRMKIGLIAVSSYPGPKTKADQIRIIQDLNFDVAGQHIDDYFVVGYGLDYNNHYRNCADIGVLKKELYTS